jgi:hypothetical protein
MAAEADEVRTPLIERDKFGEMGFAYGSKSHSGALPRPDQPVKQIEQAGQSAAVWGRICMGAAPFLRKL